jgi:hypothetical protein
MCWGKFARLYLPRSTAAVAVLPLDGLHHREPRFWGAAMTARFYDGQRYELVRTEAYTRKNGTASVRRTTCPTCGEAFEVRTASRAREFSDAELTGTLKDRVIHAPDNPRQEHEPLS